MPTASLTNKSPSRTQNYAKTHTWSKPPALNGAPCGHCGDPFPTAMHYQCHAITIKGCTAGGCTYGSHDPILDAVELCAGEAGTAYSVGDGDCKAGKYTTSSGALAMKHADIAFLNLPARAFGAQRVLGDTTIRNVVGVSGGTLTPLHGAHARAGVALQVAVAEKQLKYNEALATKPHMKCAILGIETGGG
jgi:hypothetical protein